jgi:hypothetical protein
MKHSKKSSKIINDIEYIFKNVYVLYSLVILSVVYLFMLLNMNNFNAIGFFILLGIIVYCYTKNMSIILTICLLFTLFIFPMKSKEGMTTEPTPPVSPITTPTTEPTTTESSMGSSMSSSMGVTTEDKTKEKTEGTAPAPNTTTIPTDGFTGNLAGQSRIDPASTMTQAFSNLENMLGGDGINKLSTDTQNLVDKQAQLFKVIENMTPLIEKASGLMSKFSKF